MKVIPLSEGAFTIDQSKRFVPFNLSQDELNDRPAGSLLVEIQPFLVVTTKDILLLDSGLGFKDKSNHLQLLKNIAAVGINASEITKVLVSHLHKDHACGLCNGSQPSLPGATYYIQR